MKKIALLSFLSILTLFLSCDNEPYEGGIYVPDANENNDIPDDFQNSFSAKLNGVDFIDEQIYTTISEGQGNSDFIAITGTRDTYLSIIIYIPSDISVGNYYYDLDTILDEPNLNVTYSNLDNLLESGTGEGSITIVEHTVSNHHIKGTFECVVNSQNGSVNRITEGHFNVVY
ncbi:MAG: hypothetical protein R2797_08170 [Gelidibacter sp.]